MDLSLTGAGNAEHASKMKDAFLFMESPAKEEYSFFDADPLLLNLQNGTLNLASGELQPRDRKNLLTKICSASYEDKPASPLWEETIKTILPDPAVRCWIQKFMGYCLTGSTEEEKFLIAYGPGGCGKGTFFETIAAVMGDFKAVIHIDTLLTGTFYTNGESPTPELAKLAAKRYVLSSECNKCRRLDEAR